MSPKSIKINVNEMFIKPLRKNYTTNQTDVYHIDDIWSLHILDLKDYDPENNKKIIDMC